MSKQHSTLSNRSTCSIRQRCFDVVAGVDRALQSRSYQSASPWTFCLQQSTTRESIRQPHPSLFSYLNVSSCTRMTFFTVDSSTSSSITPSLFHSWLRIHPRVSQIFPTMNFLHHNCLHRPLLGPDIVFFLLSTCAHKQGVDISFTVCLFVFVCLYGYGFLRRG